MVSLQVRYWAVDSGCCSAEGEATCDGWEKPESPGGIHWYLQDRPSTVFLQDSHLDYAAVSKAIKDNGAGQEMDVVVEWSSSSKSEVASHFDAPAWTWLVIVTLLWPLVLCLLWTAVTLGSCIFLSRSLLHLRCHSCAVFFARLCLALAFASVCVVR